MATDKLLDLGLIGIQRGDAMLVRLYLVRPPQGRRFALAITAPDGSVRRIEAAPTTDTKTTDRLNQAAATLAKRQADRVAAYPHTLDFAWTPDTGPDAGDFVRQLDVVEITVDGDVPALWLSRLWLARRIPLTRDEFRDNLTFKRGRTTDEESVYRACVDTLAWYFADAARITPETRAYVINAFIIARYKSAALAMGPCAADDYAERVRGLIAALGPAKDFREDHDHAQVSFETARWHRALQTGERDEVLAAFAASEVYCSDGKPRAMTFAFNACISLLMHGLIQSHSDPAHAMRLLDLTYDHFRAAAAIKATRQSHLAELAVSHGASVLAMKLRYLLARDHPPTKALAVEILELCCRVKTRAYIRQAYRMTMAEAPVGGQAG